ncbi:RTA1 like protein [Hymenopellis radicata]|nr:RTA1 like protein [Hymenopellis radicata]
MSESDDYYSDYRFYQYTPSRVVAAAFAGVFGLSTIIHAKQIFATRTWYFLAMMIGGIMEVGGYIARIYSHNEPDELMPYIIQSLLILLAPALYAASIYVILGRLIRYLGTEKLSVIPVRHLTKFFVCGDVLSFLVQSGGGGISAKSDTAEMGQKIILGGLGIQILWFGGFVVVSVVFHVRMRRVPQAVEKAHWTRLMGALYVGSTLILIRSAFRMVEYAGGHDGKLMKSEAWLYVFDATLMCGVMFLFNIFHPSKYLGPIYTEQLSMHNLP